MTATYEFPATVVAGATVTASTEKLVIRSCALYDYHRSPVLEAHHICPKSWWIAAGKPINTPMIDICGLCHNNTHAAIDAIIRGIKTGPIAAKTLALAVQGLDIAKQNGLTPKPTL